MNGLLLIFVCSIRHVIYMGFHLNTVAIQVGFDPQQRHYTECKLRLWWKSKLGDIVIDFNKINPFKRKYLWIDWSSSILLAWTTSYFQASLYDRIYVEGHLLKILIVILYIQQGYIHRLWNNIGWESSIIKTLHMIDFYQNYDSMYEYHCA